MFFQKLQKVLQKVYEKILEEISRMKTPDF